MFLIMIMSLIALILSIILNSLASIISIKTIEDQEKNSPFECGFDPIKPTRMPFSMRFFLITIIFLIFDVEIAFILPMIMNFEKTNLFMWIIIMILFLTILILGTIHEWNEGALDWID